MSLILEALRKSEAERRRGQVPDLHAEPAPGAVAARDGPSAWLWLALALVTAIVLSLVLWFARSVLTTPPRAVAVPVADPVPVAVGVDPARRGGADADAVAADPRPAVPAAPVPDPALAPAVVQAPAPVQPSVETAMPTRVTPPQRASIPSARETAMVPPAAPPNPGALAPVIASAPMAAPVAAPVAAPADLANATPLRLADLGVEQRRQLPPLKMSMHLWAPTQRFAIIDGVRVAEGDRIGDAVVEEITATGVVLAWQGRRLQIPVR